jgi:hypothetical protein
MAIVRSCLSTLPSYSLGTFRFTTVAIAGKSYSSRLGDRGPCAYLADDDQVPLTLQEILLTGRPTVGVRTGASFVCDGITGFVVDRLPPGRQCVENDGDQLALAVYLDALARAHNLDRRAVRSAAEQEFSSDAIVEGVIAALYPLRILAR